MSSDSELLRERLLDRMVSESFVTERTKKCLALLMDPIVSDLGIESTDSFRALIDLTELDPHLACRLLTLLSEVESARGLSCGFSFTVGSEIRRTEARASMWVILHDSARFS